MRSLVHSLLVTALMIWSAVADLRYVATLEQDGRVVDASHIEFVKTPPLRHGRHGRHASSRRDASAKDNISYSDNWCGVSHRSTPSDPVSNIFGYFTVPDLKLRPGIPAPQFAAAWIGVDGAKCNSTMLQAGVTTVVSQKKNTFVEEGGDANGVLVQVNSNGGQSASAWWEWFPEASYSIKGLTVKPGDWMSVNITIKDERTARV